MPRTNFPDAAMALAFQAIPDVIVAVNTQGVIRFMNTRAEVLSGYTNEDLSGRKVDVLVPESRRGAHVRQRTNFQKTPSKREMGVRRALAIRRKDGSLVPVTISLSPIEDGDSGIVLSTLRDVSDLERRSKEDLLLSEIGTLVSREHETQNVYELLEGALPNLVLFDRLVISLKVDGTDQVEKVFISGSELAGLGVGTWASNPSSSRI